MQYISYDNNEVDLVCTKFNKKLNVPYLKNYIVSAESNNFSVKFIHAVIIIGTPINEAILLNIYVYDFLRITVSIINI